MLNKVIFFVIFGAKCVLDASINYNRPTDVTWTTLVMALLPFWTWTECRIYIFNGGLKTSRTKSKMNEGLTGLERHEVLSHLLPLLHGNVNNNKTIINEFLEFWRQQVSSPATDGSQNITDTIPPRIHIRRIIKENAVYEKRATYRRCCWYVHAEVLARHSQEALPVPCQWTYLTSGAQNTRDEHTGSQGNSPTTASSTTPSNKRKSASSHSITKYMKKCGEQTEAMETDGFQADTEDDEDDDCIIIGEQSGLSEQDANTSLPQSDKNAEPMDTNASETAAFALPCPTPATA